MFLFCVSGVCSVVFYCFWLSVPVQLIAWTDSSPNDLLCVEWDVKPYTPTHSLVQYSPQCHVPDIKAVSDSVTVVRRHGTGVTGARNERSRSSEQVTYGVSSSVRRRNRRRAALRGQRCQSLYDYAPSASLCTNDSTAYIPVLVHASHPRGIYELTKNNYYCVILRRTLSICHFGLPSSVQLAELFI